jgi:hypothetical protein
MSNFEKDLGDNPWTRQPTTLLLEVSVVGLFLITLCVVGALWLCNVLAVGMAGDARTKQDVIVIVRDGRK